jgi:ABC-type phosphate/phosphonate transport system substrate-binding protein
MKPKTVQKTKLYIKKFNEHKGLFMMRLMIFLAFFLSSLLAKETFHIAYDASAMSSYSKKDMKIATDIWLRELMKGVDYDLDFKYYDDMTKMAADLNADKLDFVTGFGLSFVKYFDLSKLENGFGSGFLNGEQETFLLLANKNSGINSWKDLKDKTIGIDENDAIVKLYIKSKMVENFQKTEAKVIELTNRQRALLQLFFEKVDAVVVTNKTFNLLKELNPQVGQKIKIIEDTHLIATSFGFFRKSLDHHMKQDLMKVSVNLADDERGKQLLLVYKTETISESKIEDLKPIQELYEKLSKIEKGK